MMPTTTKNPMPCLLSRLGKAGIPSSFAKRMLPAWWDDTVADDPAGLQQAQLYFARAFNIELQSLADEKALPRFRSNLHKFKLSKNVAEKDVSVGANYVTGIARLALQGFAKEQRLPPRDPAELRKEILTTSECVSLPAVLAWCAAAGIPVLHINKLPGKKMAGLVVRDGGRFAIVLSKMGHPAYLLFYVGHELGHIAHGHLSADGFVADEKIDEGSPDVDEREADTYATCLLNGRDLRYTATGKIINARFLCQAAISKGKEWHVDPGHIIANYGHNQKSYALANSALAELGPPSHGAAVVNDAFYRALEPGLLSDDQLALLRIATSQD